MSTRGLRTRLLLLALVPLTALLAVGLVELGWSLLLVGGVAVLAVGFLLVAGDVAVTRPLRAGLEAREAEIERSTRDRQRLLAELVAVEEEERKRIAGDIHDDSIQALAALLLRLELLESKLENEDLRRRLSEARESAREAVARLRHLVFKLSPPALETGGLAPALKEYLDEVARVWGATTSLESAVQRDPSPELRALIYRIAVEAVNNAAKHGGGSRIDVALDAVDRGVRVRVRDDGAGFDVAAAGTPVAGHMGLRSMRERAESAGGWWRADSGAGRGTSVEFFIPDRGS